MMELESRGYKVGSDVSDVSCSDKGIAKSEDKELVRAVPWRVFINHIDSYHSGQLADVLASRLYIPPLKPQSEGEEGKSEGEKDGEGEGEEEEGEKEEKSNEYKGAGDRIKNPEKELPRKFELIGTAVKRKRLACDDVRIIAPPEDDKEKFLSEVLKCGFVIYDITQDKSQIAEANWVLNELVRLLDEERERKRAAGQQCANKPTDASPRSFIVISSVMTWAGSSGGDPALAESDHWRRRRRAHPSYRDELQCERNVAAAVSRKRAALALRACIICAGLTYGEGESLLEYAFKLAWLNDNYWLPVLGHGRNLVPLLHVRDLANAVYAVMNEWPKSNYVLAVEQGSTSQRALITAVGRALSSGRVKSIELEEACAFRDITQRVLDYVTLDLDLRPSHLLECASMQWRSTGTFCDNVHSSAREFLAVRDLQPVKLIVLGPPASGKTHLARALARYYRLPHIALNTIIPDTIRQLADELEVLANLDDDDNDEGEEDFESENQNNANEMESFLEEIRSNLRENNGRLSEDLLIRVFRRKLVSRECQNQGYVLDGYPKTLEQARLLFGQEDYPESENPNEAASATVSPLPHLVIALEARDDFLVERLINLSERDLQNSRYTEQRIHQRLQKYRQRNDNNDDVNTPLQLFDELEIHPVVVDIEQDDSPEMISTFQYCLSLIGPAHNYGATVEELEEERRRVEAEDAARSAVDAARCEIERAQVRAEREKRACHWMDLLEKLKQEEEDRLRVIAEPLRHYLARHVFPTLTQALLDVAKLRPNDSVDYLAQYLFEKNPSGRELEPDYNEKSNTTLETIQHFQNQDVMPVLVGDQDTFAKLESCNESESVKFFCLDSILSQSISASNNDLPSDEFNECG